MSTTADVISVAHHHTKLKFKLVAKYVASWIQKLMNYDRCSQVYYIDCMCNSGEYSSENGERISGTPIEVTKILLDAALKYPNKKITIVFNDKQENKINHLKSLIERIKENLKIVPENLEIEYFNSDANELLLHLASKIYNEPFCHSLLFYDPYQADIHWNALKPFLNRWGEVIINHMVMDANRGIKIAKSDEAVDKYEQTYIMKLEELLSFNGNKKLLERRVEDIIRMLHEGKRPYYIAAFPFFNRRNGLLFNLIFCSSSIDGLNLFKTTAWQTFGGRSSTKRKNGEGTFDFEHGETVMPEADDSCYYVNDIAAYIQNKFNGKDSVPLKEIWNVLQVHPIFPVNGFRNEIKKCLKENYGAKTSQSTITFQRKGIYYEQS